MLVLSSCFYIIKSKFDVETYVEWFKNFLGNVKNFNLVIYTNEETKFLLEPMIEHNDNIKLIIKSFDDFYNYKFKNQWIKNQNKNTYLPNVDWKLIMLWMEKISFVKETIDKKYFDGDWYGWCDIGYFRGRYNDINNDLIKNWPNIDKISKLDKNKIYYAMINKNNFVEYIKNCLDVNENGLPKKPIPGDQVSIAGGFFLSHKNKLGWWFDTFTKKVKLYLDNDYLIKDDQIIILNCIIENFDNFRLVEENNKIYDNWFLFQRYLL